MQYAALISILSIYRGLTGFRQEKWTAGKGALKKTAEGTRV